MRKIDIAYAASLTSLRVNSDQPELLISDQISSNLIESGPPRVKAH